MTREEIAEWMREAAGVALKASLLCKANGNPELSEHYGRVVEAFKTRAAQVEAMRCAECPERVRLGVGMKREVVQKEQGRLWG